RPLPRYPLLQEGQDLLRTSVRLSQDGDTGLLQYLRLRQLRGFRGEVGVQDTAVGGAQVFCCRSKVSDCRFEAILRSTERASIRVDLVQTAISSLDSIICPRAIANVNALKSAAFSGAIQTQNTSCSCGARNSQGRVAINAQSQASLEGRVNVVSEISEGRNSAR